MKSIQALALCVSALLSLSGATSASAAVILDTGTPTEMGGGSSLTNSSGRFQKLAALLNLDRPAVLTGIEGFIGSNRLRATYHVSLTSGASAMFGGTVPGSTLFTARAETNANDFVGWSGLSGISWSINPGTYWLVFSVDSGETLQGYMPNGAPSPAVQEAFFNQNSTNWQLKQPGLGVRVNGDLGPLPPPPPPPPLGVPEPATWSLMILGFGLIGGMMRRRSQRVIVQFAKV